MDTSFAQISTPKKLFFLLIKLTHFSTVSFEHEASVNMDIGTLNNPPNTTTTKTSVIFVFHIYIGNAPKCLTMALEVITPIRV